MTARPDPPPPARLSALAQRNREASRGASRGEPDTSAERHADITKSARPRKDRTRRGLTIVYTGDGKGKTTAAIGLTVRAAGNRMRVLFVQFIKGSWKSGEREILRGLPNVEVAVTGRGFTIDGLRDVRIPMQVHHDAASAGWTLAQQAIHADQYDMVVLDEILGALNAGLISLDDVLETVRSRPRRLHLVLTGRGAPAALVDLADLVSDVRSVKHPYEQGIAAQRGIEF